MSEENAKCEDTHYLFTLSQRKGVLCPQPLRVVCLFSTAELIKEDSEISKEKKAKRDDFGKLSFSISIAVSRESREEKSVHSFEIRLNFRDETDE